jgi:hypothetical protein
MNERRSAERIFTDLRLNYRIRGNGFSWQEAQIVDLSETGVRLVSQGNGFIPGMPLEVSLLFPESNERVNLGGIIVWSRKNAGEAECGISFQGKRRVPMKTRMVQFLADRIAELAFQNGSDAFNVQTARSTDDLNEIRRLLYLEYLKRGYVEENSSGFHYTDHSLLPKTKTFLLREKSSLVGTISLISDSSNGLPMESVFPAEVKTVRSSGRRIAEASLLALSSEVFKRGCFSMTSFKKFKALFLLFKILFEHVRVGEITDLLITVHPKHEALYRYLRFEVMGPIRFYPGACQKPALPMKLDLRQAIESVSCHSGIGLYFLNDKPVLWGTQS